MSPDTKLNIIICSALTGCITVVCLLVFLISLFLPKPFHPDFRVDSAIISSLNTTTPDELTATWNITLLAISSDHKNNVQYYVVQVWLYYGRIIPNNYFVLATTILPPFVLI
ncbi:hypothetical protein ACLB2K_047917 [Fragaria x ananassa]